MEQEGFIAYRLTLTARKDATLRDARLEVPFARNAAVYAMGMGRVGGYRPESHDWKWEVRQSEADLAGMG